MTRRFGPAPLAAAAVVVGWAGLYFAYRSSRLGVVLMLVATAVLWTAIRGVERLARARSDELRHALDAAAARNRELERLRHLAATLLAGTDPSRLIDEVAAAAAELLEAEAASVTLLVEEGRFLRVAAATGPLAGVLGG